MLQLTHLSLRWFALRTAGWRLPLLHPLLLIGMSLLQLLCLLLMPLLGLLLLRVVRLLLAQPLIFFLLLLLEFLSLLLLLLLHLFLLLLILLVGLLIASVGRRWTLHWWEILGVDRSRGAVAILRRAV